MEAATTKRSTKNRFFADRAHSEIIETAHMVTVLKINNAFKQLSIFAKQKTPNLDVYLILNMPLNFSKTFVEDLLSLSLLERLRT